VAARLGAGAGRRRGRDANRAAYLRAYGPATAEAFDRYLTRGTSPKAAVRRRFEAVADLLADVEVDGAPMSVLAEDVVELCAIRPSSVVRLLGPFDQYVLGPSTSDPLVLEPAHRSEVSRPPAGSPRSSSTAGTSSASGRPAWAAWTSGCSPGPTASHPRRSRPKVERVTGLLAKS
jgi:hypothetical protein